MFGSGLRTAGGVPTHTTWGYVWRRPIWTVNTVTGVASDVFCAALIVTSFLIVCYFRAVCDPLVDHAMKVSGMWCCLIPCYRFVFVV